MFVAAKAFNKQAGSSNDSKQAVRSRGIDRIFRLECAHLYLAV